MSLIDSAIRGHYRPTAAQRIETQTRDIMAARARLRHVPGAHALMAEMIDDVDALLDEWLLVSHPSE